MSSFLSGFLLLEQPRDMGTARSLRERSPFTGVRESGVRLPPGVRVEAGVRGQGSERRNARTSDCRAVRLPQGRRGPRRRQDSDARNRPTRALDSSGDSG